ncbi:amino acid adenylation domain-containing protein [Streptomyces sp. TYQ1024]|uniref:amino acid adenylation domain-containing protein n=1 Tax=Streptomyces sp. TYQ1024 TaxID=2762559 RepID=UPI00236754C5|nr:amino acid adenylation domain-containing protein [Streptomyces sp. TYQ1024]
MARFADRVRRDPSAPAVEDGELTWTYAELDALADRTADALRDRVRPGDLVGVCLDRSAALVATAVALARLGAVYLPLGPRPGERRLAAVADVLRVTCLVGTADALPEAARVGGTLPLPLPAAGANITGEPVAAFPETPAGTRRGAPEGTLYAVLTSGTTGVPKAVAVSSAALAARLDWYTGRTGCGPGDRHNLLVGVAFDPHLMELWAGLTSGAALSVAPDDVRWDPQALTDWWRRAGVTVAILPTPLAELVLERPWPRDLPLRHLSTGGDRLRRVPGPDVTARVDNNYGPAEATVLVTAHALNGTDASAPPPIGTPLPGVVACVTDADGRLVPHGEPGELRIGGDGLAIGYLDPELTARRFVPPPAGVTGTDRVYRTGDRVRMRPDGVLEFLGRLDAQLKVRGVRVEPAEVEAAFERDPRVLRTVVAADTAAGGGVRLVAFVRPAPGVTAPTVDELLAAVRGWLPEQAVPSAVRLVDAFPVDANGKVDREALLAGRREEATAPRAGRTTETTAPPADRPEGATAAQASSLTEDLVVGLCRDLLGRPDLGADANFLGSGGDSLSAARLLTALEEHCGVRLRAPEVLRQPDLRALAALLDARRGPAAAPGAEPTADRSTEDLVVGLCRELLGRPDLEADANFLGSGGDSLSAARLLTALEEHCGVRLRAPEVLRQPDLRALAALLDARREPVAGAADGTAVAAGPRAEAASRPAESTDRPAKAASRPAKAASRPGGVLGRVLTHAAATPGALAVRDADDTLTYAELTDAARRLAGVLRARGVGRGDAVGVLLPHSTGVVVAQLAVWWAGGHYVPLDAAYPRARIAAMLADAGVVLTVGGKDLLEAAGVPAARALAVSAAGGTADEGAPLGERELPEPCAYDAEAVAYTMFTSGSTGRPKAVAIPHRAVAELVTEPEFLTVTPRDRVLFHSPLAFDASPFELWTALANGAAAVVSTADRESLENLARDVERLGATVALFTTALFHHLAARGSAVFGVLRGVIVGGEALSGRLAHAVLRRHPWLELVNGYGPTEATSFATAHRVLPADGEEPPPIGRPIAGATAHVRDEHGAPVPAGVRGELWIGGSRLALGYLGQPERTAEAFAVDPADPAHGRLYRTGDLVSARPDGTLDFHGRLDDQVKVRGYRIEPGEIEHALRSHAGVADAAVTVLRPDASDGAGSVDARLAAFVVPAEGARPSPAALREHLAGLLPAHMLPSAWSLTDRLPVTANGKVDRAALAGLPLTAPDTADVPSRELTPLQQAVAAAWARALDREVTDPDADFLALGGHSLLALGIVDDLREDLGVELSLAAFFAAPTVAGQAELVERELAAAFGQDEDETEAGR